MVVGSLFCFPGGGAAGAARYTQPPGADERGDRSFHSRHNGGEERGARGEEVRVEGPDGGRDRSRPYGGWRIGMREGEKERRSVSRDDPPLRDNDVSFKLLCSKLL